MSSSDETRRQAASAVGDALARLDQIVCNVAEALDALSAQALRASAAQSRIALALLHADLERDATVQVLQRMPGAPMPQLERAIAEPFCAQLTELIQDMEHRILLPLEAVLPEEELAAVKRRIGQVWGNIVCDLQIPIWRAYPDLEPR